jgi:hypothetical protein
MTTRHIEGRDGIEKYLNDTNRAKRRLATRLATAAGDWREAYGEIALPNVDLRQQTYGLLSLVREPSSDEKDALKERGIKFVHVESRSYAQVVAEDTAYFRNEQLEYANARPELRGYVLPVAVEVGLKPSELALPDSFGKSRETQLRMIDEYSQELQKQFPDVRAIMLPSTGYAQVDRAYKAETGEVLFRVYYARALDNFSGGYAVHVGRYDPSHPLSVNEWLADDGHHNVAAVPAVVFLRK